IDYLADGSFAVDGDTNDGSVEIFSFDDSVEKRPHADLSEVYSVKSDVPSCEGESEETAAIVRRIVGLVRDEDRSYGDIAVLVRRRGVGEDRIAADLRALGVPVSLGTAAGRTEGRADKLLVSVLRLADNFYDDISLTAVMLSPMGGFTEDELAAIRAAHHAE